MTLSELLLTYLANVRALQTRKMFQGLSPGNHFSLLSYNSANFPEFLASHLPISCYTLPICNSTRKESACHLGLLMEMKKHVSCLAFGTIQSFTHGRIS